MRKVSYFTSALLLGLALASCSSENESHSGAVANESALTVSGVDVVLTLTSDWTSGYCANVTLTNKSGAAVTNWSVAIELNQSTVNQVWGGTSKTSGTTLTVTPEAFNSALAAGASVSFGFCGTSTGTNYKPVVATATMTSGQGGSSGAGGASANGGSSALGGSKAAGGSSATGGSKAAGGSSATGGSKAAGGTTSSAGAQAVGGATASGGSTALPACVADTVKRTSYCMPSTDSISGLVGSATISGVTFKATGSVVQVTTPGPLPSGQTLTGLSPYNTGNCAGAGVNATSAATGQAYSGLGMSITNSGAVPVNISIYIDAVATGGQHIQRRYPFAAVPADGLAHAYNLTWDSAHTDSCQLPSSSLFDQTKITGIGFGIDANSVSSAINMSFTNIAFTGGGAASPCSSFCSNPTTFTIAGTYSAGNIGTGALCQQTTSNFTGGGCGNFLAPRTLYVNGVAMNCASSWAPPAKVNGGYCFSAPAGDYAWAYFSAW